MRRLYIASFAYMAAGVLSGLFFREFTKLNGFPEGAPTQLGLAHTHLLTLGFIVLLIVLALEKVFALSRSRLFGWFFWLYNAGVILTSGMLIWHGILTVLGLAAAIGRATAQPPLAPVALDLDTTLVHSRQLVFGATTLLPGREVITTTPSGWGLAAELRVSVLADRR